MGPPAGAANGDIIRWSFQQLNRHDAAAMSELWTEESYVRFPIARKLLAGELDDGSVIDVHSGADKLEIGRARVH